MMKIGLVGLGRMGGAMARRLVEQGHSVVGWDLRAKQVEALGNTIEPAAHPRAVAEAADAVLSIITEDNGIRRVFTAKDGFLEANVDGKIFIEMSTLQPMTIRELAPQVEAKGARLVDSPVLGTIPSVRDGKLVALMGGRDEDVARAKEILSPLTRRVIHMGPSGSGSVMKLAANLGMGTYLQAVAEALALGDRYGLSVPLMLDALMEGAFASPWLKAKTEQFKGAKGDTTLDVKSIRKDLMSAVATGAIAGVPMPATAGALASASAAVAHGLSEEDCAVIPQFYRQHMIQKLD
jgi:3-hydroxyisobutyrate dehydrogenase-like beta-hydroxyacid dehydrogenase